MLWTLPSVNTLILKSLRINVCRHQSPRGFWDIGDYVLKYIEYDGYWILGSLKPLEHWWLGALNVEYEGALSIKVLEFKDGSNVSAILSIWLCLTWVRWKGFLSEFVSRGARGSFIINMPKPDKMATDCIYHSQGDHARQRWLREGPSDLWVIFSRRNGPFLPLFSFCRMALLSWKRAEILTTEKIQGIYGDKYPELELGHKAIWRRRMVDDRRWGWSC